MANSINPASTLTDEELDAALAELEIPNPPDPKPEAEEPKPKEPEKPKADPAPEADPPEEEEPDKPETPPAKEEPKADPEADPKEEPSRREQLRIQDLLRKYPPKTDPAKPEPKSPEGALDIDKDVDADEELKKRLLADRKAAADAAYEQGRTESNQEKASILFHTRLEVDAPRVEAKYPVLDKDSDKFKPALAKAINTMYLNATGYDFDTDAVQNPNIRYSDFVEALFELGDEIGTTKVTESTKNIEKQASKTALRPDGSSAKPKLNLNQLPHQMSDEELDAAIAQMLPS